MASPADNYYCVILTVLFLLVFGSHAALSVYVALVQHANAARINAQE